MSFLFKPEVDKHSRMNKSSTIGKILRFSATGLLNTAVDFGVTNILSLLWRPQNLLALAVISIIACSCGMISSYFGNRYWTFRSHAFGARRREVMLFFLMAGLSMLVNTSIFLFSVQYLSQGWEASKLLMINVSKLAGVVAGSFVGFFCYNFIVFENDTVLRFKGSFDFKEHDNADLPFWQQTGWLMILALLVRIGFLFLTTAVVGDAVQYANIAKDLVSGNLAHIDRFWLSLFSYWEAIFNWIGTSPTAAAILAALIPGVLLLIPVVWIARTFYGTTPAWLAGLFCVFHPRLISYSTNGYAEMFYLCLQAMGIACLIAASRKTQKGILNALVWGAAFGAYAAVRNEGILFFSLTALVPLVRKQYVVMTAGVIAFILALLAYMALAEATLGTSGMFQKGDMLRKQYSEQLDYERAAREVYGEQALSRGLDVAENTSFLEMMLTLLKRYPRNILYCLQRMPGILLSPIFLFALLLPAFASIRFWGRDQIPLMLMGLFPLVFYPLIQLEPRYLFGILIPTHIFGSAGLYAFYIYLEEEAKFSYAKAALQLVVVSVLLANVVTTILLGKRIETDYMPHRILASWIQQHVPDNESITGDGYGYISNTGFLTDRPYSSRLWTEDSQRLVQFMHQNHIQWLVLYEPFVEKFNSALLPNLDSGIPGTKKMHEIKDRLGKRYQIYRLERN